MRILYILPGSGGSFYCQNCLRDMALADALRQRGHTVISMPLYLPATAQAAAPDAVPVFYGAVSLYLRHRFAVLRRLPRAWFAPLDAWPVLRLAARLSESTSATGLEDLTLSMLQGEEGRQAEELQRVAEWIAALPLHEKPELIVLSNALLIGLARALKQAARCPLVCWLQDEHVWLDAMDAALRSAALRVMAARADAVDRFVAVSASYADRMAEWLALDRSRFRVVYPGLDPSFYQQADPARQPPVIGFLSRLSAEEGFDRFVDAFLLLRRDSRFSDVRLAATGGPSADRRFLKRQRRKLAATGALADAEITPDRFAHDRVGFLAGLSVLSVPGGSAPEALGYYALEAMAAGVPLVLPAHGAFPELADLARCGVLTPDAQPETLARAWAELLADPERLRRESERGLAAARTHFSHDACAAAFERAVV